MNRRNFFRSLALLGTAASLSPQIFIPKFEPVRWKKIIPALPRGWFIAEFKYAIAPTSPEFEHILFHKRDAAPVVTFAEPNSDWKACDAFKVTVVGDKRMMDTWKADDGWKLISPNDS